MVRIMRHRRTKGPETDRPDLTHRATSRLHQGVRSRLAIGDEISSRDEMSSSSLRHLIIATSVRHHPGRSSTSFTISSIQDDVSSSHKFGMRLAFGMHEADEGRYTLRITFQETNTAVEMKLEGRVAGPWADELDRVWRETAPKVLSKELIIDLHNVTYADLVGKHVLQKIYTQTNARFVAVSPSSRFLVEEITLTTPASKKGN